MKNNATISCNCELFEVANKICSKIFRVDTRRKQTVVSNTIVKDCVL